MNVLYCVCKLLARPLPAVLLPAACCLLWCNEARAQFTQDTTQRDLIDYAIKWIGGKPPRPKDDTSKKVRFSLAPASGGAQDRLSLSTINMAFYRGNPANTNLSTVYFYPYTNFSGRYYFNITSTFWSSENKFNSLGDLRISSVEYEDYGLGSNTSPDSLANVAYNQHRAHIQVSRLLMRYLYAGVGYALDYYYNQSESGPATAETDFSNYPYGTARANLSSGLTVNILRDSRKNSINPDDGFYSNLTYRIYRPETGSSFSWEYLYLDLRKYFPVNTRKKSILAIRTLYWDTFGDVPYLDLPATMTDRESRMGRGYNYARFRGKGMLYGEAEYRFTLSQNQFWGGVVFVNAHSFREPGSGGFEYINPAAGFGLRMKFNKRSNTNLTLDFAFGRDSFTWHLNIGEFF